MEEIWKDIKGYEGLYKISNLGRIYSIPRHNSKGGYKKFCDDGYGYWQIGLSKNGVPVIIKVHKLVYKTFVGEIPQGYEIHHINHNRKDNRVENLELVETSEHKKIHAKDFSVLCKLQNIKRCSKTVLQYTKDGQFVAEYPSTTEAARQTGVNQSSISKCCRKLKKFKTAGGFIWKYKNN